MKEPKALHERRNMALSQSPCSVIRDFLANHGADEKEWDAIDAVESCGFGNRIGTDLCLPNAYRTEANLWKAKYFEMADEVRKCNKGIERLKRKIHSQNSAEQTKTINITTKISHE
jgi:hypothetical protein